VSCVDVIGNMDEKDPLRGLSQQERFACLVAQHLLGAKAHAWDTDGRQGAVDAMLALADGRRASFEVTSLAAPGALQTDSLLHRDGYAWPCPGQWWWTVQVGDIRDLPRLREIYPGIVLRCEIVGATRPEQLRWRLHERDPDLRWLVEESSSDMVGHPDVPCREGDLVRDAMVVPAGRGGGGDAALTGLRQALLDAFREPHLARHIQKVAASDGDERHLFITVHWSALPFSVAYGLWTGDALPPDAPPLPTGVTHLWLTGLGQRVLLGDANGWQQHWLPDYGEMDVDETHS